MSVIHRSRLEQRLPARPESITTLRRAVVEYAAGGGVSQRRREDVALAISEALSNVVMHAYDDRDVPGDVWVDAWIDGDALQITVGDDGSGIARRRPSPGLGLGLALIGQVADTLQIERYGSGPGLRVRMTFALL